MTPQEYIELESDFGAHNYHPLPVVLERGEGVHVYDVTGKKYLDFLSAYSAVNQGHCHPRLVKAISEQAARLTLSSRAFHTNLLGSTEKKLAEKFGYEKVLLMNTGVEAGESAIKLARKWAYEVKGVPANQAEIIFAEGNFWGRTLAAIYASGSKKMTEGFGPKVGGFDHFNFGDHKSLKKNIGKNTAAIMVETIMGEGGIKVIPDWCLRELRKICNKKNILLILDEVQCGIGRSGDFFAFEKSKVKPDIVPIAKGIGGGFPVGAVLMNKKVASGMTAGTHGSTFGGNPLAMTVGNSVMDIISNKKFLKNVKYVSEYFLSNLNKIQNEYPNIIKEIRGRGLLIGIQLKIDQTKFIKKLMDNNLLTIRAAENVVRILPPLNVKKSEINQSLKIIKKVCLELN